MPGGHSAPANGMKVKASGAHAGSVAFGAGWRAVRAVVGSCEAWIDGGVAVRSRSSRIVVVGCFMAPVWGWVGCRCEQGGLQGLVIGVWGWSRGRGEGRGEGRGVFFYRDWA